MKSYFLHPIIFVLFCIFTSYVSAEANYKFINKKDISYANVKRGAIRIKISNNIIPSESEFKKVALDSWKKHRGHWRIGSVYLYVKDMPTNSTAYAVATIKNLKIERFTVSAWALEMHESSKKKNKGDVDTKIIKNSSSFIEDDNLHIGKKYILSKKTPVMPSPNPKDKIDALKKVFYLKSMSIIKINKKMEVGINLWYQVDTFSFSGKFIGPGWINSIALVGQKMQRY